MCNLAIPRLNKETLASELGYLPARHQLAFSVSCCERLYPCYEAFCVIEGLSTAIQLRSTVDELWAHVSGKTLTDQRVAVLKDEVEQIHPDHDEFSSLFFSSGAGAI